jgi:putative FmdB family regulatory protein
MPVYEYTCQSCQSRFEQLHRSMSETGGKVACPKCKSTKTARALSVFAVGAEGPKSSESDAPSCGRCGGAPGSCMMD